MELPIPTRKKRGYCAVGLLLLASDPVQAQSAAPAGNSRAPIAPSQVTIGGNRETPAPVPSGAAPTIDEGGTSLAAPEGADRLVVTVQSVLIEGEAPRLDGALAELRARVVGRPVTLAEVYRAAGQLEAAYARAGFVLMRVNVPPQRIESAGSLRLELIDGTIEAVDATGVPAPLRRRVAAHLAPLVGRHFLRLAELERRLTLAGDEAGLTLRSGLTPGEAPGTTRLILAGSLTPVAASLSLDNSLPAALGRTMLMANVTFNNLAGLGEQVTLNAGQQGDLGRFGFRRSPYATAGASVSLPLNAGGLSVTASYLHAHTREAAHPAYLSSAGSFTRYGGALNKVIVANHHARLALSLGADRVVQTRSLPYFGVVLDHDDYASLRLGAQGWRLFADGASLSGEVHFARGLAGRKAPAATGTPGSGSGARTGYSRLDGRLAWRAALDRRTSFTLAARAQTSFGQTLLLSERMALASPDGVSATLPGGLDFDSGMTLRDELARAIPISGRGWELDAAPYLFSAIGLGRPSRSTAQQQGSQAVQALGGGLRANARLGATRARFAIEYGRCLCPASLGRDESRVNVSLALGI